MDSKIVQVALNGLENILRLGEQEAKRNGTGINPYCALIEEAYGKIECLVDVLKLYFSSWFSDLSISVHEHKLIWKIYSLMNNNI